MSRHPLTRFEIIGFVYPFYDYDGNRPLALILRQRRCSLMYDVYWLACWLLLWGSKYSKLQGIVAEGRDEVNVDVREWEPGVLIISPCDSVSVSEDKLNKQSLKRRPRPILRGGGPVLTQHLITWSGHGQSTRRTAYTAHWTLPQLLGLSIRTDRILQAQITTTTFLYWSKNTSSLVYLAYCSLSMYKCSQ